MEGNAQTSDKKRSGKLMEKGIHEEEPILREECIGCGRKPQPDDSGVVIFLCPNCGKGIIVRCSQCRKRAQVVHCPFCGFRYP